MLLEANLFPFLSPWPLLLSSPVRLQKIVPRRLGRAKKYRIQKYGGGPEAYNEFINKLSLSF